MAMELEIKEEPEAEEEAEGEEVKQAGEAMPAGVELEISLKNPEIHIDKLIIKKKE